MKLSPTAQAVKAAAIDAYWLFHPNQAAVILRSAAAQVIEEVDPVEALVVIVNELSSVPPQIQ